MTSIFLLQLKHFVQHKILHNRLQVHTVMNVDYSLPTGDNTQFGRQVITSHKNLQ